MLEYAQRYDFFFDAAVVTRGKLEMYNKTDQPMPEGWALDQNGQPSTDAADVLANIVAKKDGGIMPHQGGAFAQI